MTARDDYPQLVKMLNAMAMTDEPDWLDIRTFDADALNKALDEIDELHAECDKLLDEANRLRNIAYPRQIGAY